MTEYTQAFPTAIPDNAFFQEGMTLRDYFAAKAMQSIVSAEYSDRLDSATWCQHAYQMADAMLEARNK